MSPRVQAVLVALGAFVVAFAVVYIVGRLLETLILVLAGLGAGAFAGLHTYRYVERRNKRTIT